MIAAPQTIEQELAKVQRESSPTEARTLILNLVVFSSEGSRHRADQALSSIIGKRAARVIHITDSNQQESDISLSARCYLDRERRSVCVQEVLVTNGADGLGQAPGSWSPLLIRDLPTYVLWLRPIASDRELLGQAIENADKLIVDTDAAVAGGEAPDAVRSALEQAAHMQEVVVTDFAWRRTVRLRRLAAHAFDSEETAPYLSRLASVSVHGEPYMTGALLLAWVAARLGIEPGGSRDRDRLALGLEPGDGTPPVSISFETTAGEHVRVSGQNDGCADLEGTPHITERPAFTIPSDGEILLTEIDRVQHERIYLEALSALPAVLQLVGGS
jgi:glucose-6-phosphate dehydrogenase assembly protein OpcA